MKNCKVLVCSLALAAVTMLTAVVPASAAPNEPVINQLSNHSAPVMLRGNVSPMVKSMVASKEDLGEVGSTVPTGTLFVLLRRNSSEQRTLDNYVLSLSTEGSLSYHKWLTPTQYGKRFGAKSQDITAVKTWLESQGFGKIKVNKAKTTIEFSGTMGSVKTAFKTEVHKFDINGKDYFANISNPQIPASLAPIVKGIVGLDRPAPNTQVAAMSQSTPHALAVKPKPELSGVLFGGFSPYVLLTAGDASVIYDTPNAAMNPAYNGATVDGTGVTIGAVELSNLSSADLQIFADYRTTFLNNTAAQAKSFIPTIVVEGTDPGVNNDLTGDFDAEYDSPAGHAIDDGEISQALAPGSKTILYVAPSVEPALARAIDDNQVSILIVSIINDCESNLGAAYNAFLSSEYEQAAAQGITVVASTGEMGSEGCYGDNYNTSSGLGVNGAASTPWDVAVGGSEFPAVGTDPSQYFNLGSLKTGISNDGASAQVIVGSPPYYITALSYVPEGTWNGEVDPGFTTYQNNTTSTAGGTYRIDTSATGGGRSSQAVCSGTISSSGDCTGTLAGYAKPAWQTALTPKDGVRDLPDITLFAAPGRWTGTDSQVRTEWAICGNSCTGSNPAKGAGTAKGTATSAAAAAGIFALVEQSQGQRLGLVTPTLYRLASLVPSVFHDITAGNNSVPCTLGSKDCGPNSYLNGYNADIGYDLATGLGSLDVAKLVANWGNAGLNGTTVVLTASTNSTALGSGAISVTHGFTVYFNAAVTPDSATGNVALIDNSGDEDGAALPSVALSNGTASFASPSLPGGSYMVQASYGGDANDIGAESNSISVTVTPELTTLGLAIDANDPASGKVGQNLTTVPYGMFLAVAVTPYGSAGEGKGTIPTGTVSATYGGTSLGSGPLNVVADSGDLPGTGYVGYFNAKALHPGSQSIAVSYSGDSSYKPAQANIGFTVTKGQVMVVTGVNDPKCTTLKSDWGVQATCPLGGNVDTDSRGDPPTGNISISFNGKTYTVPLSVGPGTGTGSGGNQVNAVAQTPVIDVTSYVGTHLPGVTASYAGDANYQAGNGSDTTTREGGWVIPEPAGAAFALSTSGAISVSAGASGSSTITVTPASGFVGQVALTCTVSGGAGGEEPTCSIPSSATVTNSSPQTITLNLNTSAATANVRKESGVRVAGVAGFGGFVGLLLCGLLIRKRRLAVGLFILVLSVSLLVPTLSGCGGGGAVSGNGGGAGGGGGTGNPGTLAGTYTVTVVGSNPNVTYNEGWVSSPITSSTSVSVTVD